VSDSKDFEGQSVGIHKKTFTINQKWTLTYVDRAEDVKTRGMYTPYNMHLGRPFYIQSRLPMQRVVTVVGGRNLVLKTMDRTNQSQVFFLDPTSHTIKSVQ